MRRRTDPNYLYNTIHIKLQDLKDSEQILAEVLPLLVKGFRIRVENCNTPSVSLHECKKLLRDIIQIYTAADPAMTHSLDAKDVISARANLDLVTFFHLELRRTDENQPLVNTASMVCYIVKSLTSYGIKSFQDFVTFMNVEDAHKLELLPENKKEVIRIINLTKQRQSTLQSKDVESFVTLQSHDAIAHMTEEQTNKLLASLTCDDTVHDAFNRPVISVSPVISVIDAYPHKNPYSVGRYPQKGRNYESFFLQRVRDETFFADFLAGRSPRSQDGLARLCFPPILFDKLVHLLDSQVKVPTKLPLLEKGVEAIGMLLAVAEGKDHVCLPNNQGHLAVGQVSSAGIKPRYYCNRKLPRQSSTCAADNGGKQCQSCASLQLRADQILLPLQEKHVIDIRENQVSLADCREALIKVMKAYPLSTRIQAWGCTAIFSLADWGNRGNSLDFVPAITNAIEEHKWDEPVLLCAMRALIRLLNMIADKGLGAAEANTHIPADYPKRNFILEEVTELMLVHRKNIDLQLLGLKCLCFMASENVKEIAAGWGLEAIIRALHEHCNLHSGTAEFCCEFFRTQSCPLIFASWVVTLSQIRA
jgi:hypothetical protein